MPNSPEGESKATNLARIRDNQRRSRQRRKEYVQELEAKAREFDTQGVRASAEMQTAARKVLEENRRLQDEITKLRNLLSQMGVNESEINRATTSTSSASSVHEQSLASPTFQHNLSTTRETLEALLVSRSDILPTRGESSGETSGSLFENPTLESRRLHPRNALRGSSRQIPSLLRTPSNQSERSTRHPPGLHSLARSSRSTSISDEVDDYSSVTSGDSTLSASLVSAPQDFFGMTPVSYNMSMATSTGWPQPTAYPTMAYTQAGPMQLQQVPTYGQPYSPVTSAVMQSVLPAQVKSDEEYQAELQRLYPPVTYPPSSDGHMGPWR